MILSRIYPFVFSVLIWLNGLVTCAQSTHSEMGLPFIKTYLPVDYNGEAQNWGFIQDSTGVIYIANTIGFMEYDGVTWRQFKPDNDGIPISFAKDKDGLIYSSGTKFFGCLKPDSTGEIRYYSLTGFLPKGYSLGNSYTMTDYQGDIYFFSLNDVLCWNGKSFKIRNFPDKVSWLAKSEDQLYVSTEKALYIITDDGRKIVNWNGKPANIDVRLIYHLSRDTLVIGTRTKGFYWLVNENLQPIDNAMSRFLRKNHLFTSLMLPDGRVALATKRSGLVIINRDLSVYYRITKDGGLADNDVKTIFLDRGNNLWLGTDRGFSHFAYPLCFTWFDDGLGLTGTVEEIRMFRENLILGTSDGAFKMRPASREQMLTDELPYAKFEYIKGSDMGNMALIGINDKLLIGSNSGTFIYDDKKLRLFDTHNARKFLYSSQNHSVMFEGHRDGCDVLLLEGDRIKMHIPIKGIKDQIRGIAEAADGRLWLGSLVHGVYRVTFDSAWQVVKLEHFGVEDGLPSLRDNLIYRIDDKVIFTTHKGIFRFDENSHKFMPDATFGDEYANYSRFIYAFYYDDEKNAWLHAFRKKETVFADRQADGSYRIDRATFTPMRNMQMYEIYKEPEGAAWFGGSDGLVRYDPELAKGLTGEVLRVKIRKVIADEDSTLFMGHVNDRYIMPVLDYNHRNLRFQVAALAYEGDNEYQYFLEGYDGGWSPWSKEHFKIYTNLGYGNYVFKTKARNIKGLISSVDSFRFTILPPWYMTWWILGLLYILATAVFIYIIHYFSTRKLIKKVEQLELVQKAQKQRERISRDLHDNVGSNLTYIISSLDYMTHRADKQSEVSSKAQQLSEFTRDTIQQLRDTIWHISSYEVALSRFVDRINEMCLRYKSVHENVTCRVEATGKQQVTIPPLQALNLFRSIQEAVNNVFKHAEASLLKVIINCDDQNYLTIEIFDNGKGFEVNELDLEEHYGLANLEARMKDIGANYSIKSEAGKFTSLKIDLQL